MKTVSMLNLYLDAIWKRRLRLGILLFIFSISTIYAQPNRIYLEGEFDDWQSLQSIHSDPAGDQNSGNTDFGNVWATNDERFFLLRIQLGEEINLQDLNSITLYLDTDNNASTGIQALGIGAELEWTFGTRSGRFVANGSTSGIGHASIGVVTAPTVSSTEFEIALNRNALPDGQSPLFPNSEIRFAFQDRGPGGDVIPNESGGIAFTFSDDPLPPVNQIAIAKQHPNSIRILSYNVEVDGIFQLDRQASYTRILQAIQPDIIGFQEIFSHSLQDVENLIETMLPSGSGEQWHVARVQSDNFVASRFPITGAFGIQGTSNPEANGAFLIDLRPKFATDLLLLVAHPPCCANNDGRQFEIDAMMAFIRDAKNPGGPLTIAPDTPIMILGDMNLVGFNQQLQTLLTGNIINAQFRPSFAPDWDGSDFGDLIPRAVNLPMSFTWFNEGSSFSPGRLDFMIFSDSVFEPLKQFVLFTPTLPPDTLAKYNLQAPDAIIASDHLPVVGDFRPLNVTGIANNGQLPTEFILEQNFPNPFNPLTTIRYHLQQRTEISLKIYNLSGEEVITLVSKIQAAGTHSIQWDGRNHNGEAVGSGVYFYKLQAAGFSQSKKLVLLR